MNSDALRVIISPVIIIINWMKIIKKIIRRYISLSDKKKHIKCIIYNKKIKITYLSISNKSGLQKTLLSNINHKLLILNKIINHK